MAENSFSYEIIFVNDGSTDNSWQIINDMRVKSDNIHAIRFRKNYGKSPALFCGFEKAKGDVVITLDADLQDSPDEIPDFFYMIKNDGYDLVSGWKKKRYDNTITKNLPSKIYNSVARKVTGLTLHDMNCGIKAYRLEVVRNIEVYGEMHRYIPYLAKNAGFTKIGEKVVEHRKREFGTTKFGMERFVNGYLDLFSLWFLNKFGKKPMHFFGLWGSVMFLFGFLAIILVGLVKFIALHKGTAMPLVTNTPYFYIALTMMILGTQMFLSGFVGELVARNSETRNAYNIVESF
ncbi:MAG: glycosyltransferase family 2 protein, partial [Prevotellaceae bacterium]|jgi:glycosyltransferase involved in cell wall biosynthesis|nr:glycosyltransferase family 2 protein [Prevotellaceae bacterium]